MKTVHFIGIGGVGMSALAQACLDRGDAVSGSDRLLAAGLRTPVLEILAAQGCELFPQDGSGIRSPETVVVYSTAIEADNPDLLRANAIGCRVLHRSAALAMLCEGRETVAVTGTCGKSTVTAMLGHLLAVCGRDPLVIDGAEMTGLDEGCRRVASVRPSALSDGLAVIEADESDRSLMALSPTHAIITNASSDHFPKAEAEALFAAFRAKTPGIIVDATDAPPEPTPACDGWNVTFDWRGRLWTLPMPGAHNVANAKAALAMALALGCDADVLARGLVTFRGIRRRLERIGTCRGAWVVDDYAHNIEKLHAAWTTLAAAAPGGVCGLWRPHGYAPLRKMKEGLAAMFNATLRPCDRLLLLPVYDAGGTADRSVTSDDLAATLTCPVTRVETLAEAEGLMRDFASPGRILVVFGARDPGLPVLAAKLCDTPIPSAP